VQQPEKNNRFNSERQVRSQEFDRMSESQAAMNEDALRLTSCAAEELERMRLLPKHTGANFPQACRKLVSSLPGNNFCADCNAPNPEWASVSFGCLICLRCSGRHRSYGVSTSFVRSLGMDSWSLSQVLSMLEGGNNQLNQFFERHEMANMPTRRYHTKAAKFYRTNMQEHVDKVSNKGIYRGREVNRLKPSRRGRRTPPKSNTTCSNNCDQEIKSPLSGSKSCLTTLQRMQDAVQ
jgi:hypothetical protein